MPRANEENFLTAVLKSHGPAITFCQTLFQISQTLDDLVDRDKPIDDLRIYLAFWQSLIELPGNPFYRQHELMLRPLMAAALQDWWDATQMERTGGNHEKTLSFVLRDMLTGIVIQCAGIIGGWAWMQQVSVEVRRHFHEDTLEEYLEDL